MKKNLALTIVLSFFLVSVNAWAQGVIDNTSIGTTTPQEGHFTNLEATTDFKLGSETASSFEQINNNKVKSSLADPTAGFLSDELQAGDNVTITEVDVSGNKKVSVSVADKLTTKGDVLTHNGTGENRLTVGASGQVLTVDPASASGVKWAAPATDITDGVKITFTRELDYDPGTGSVPAIDINGEDLVISQTDPTVKIAGQSYNVLFTGDIPYTTPTLQQVIVEAPTSRLTGNYSLELSNSQGGSELSTFLSFRQGGNDSFTKLLISADGTGNSFTDSSASAHTLTANGDTTQSATQSQFGGKSGAFDSNGDTISVPNSADFDFGSGDFTIDMWVYFNTLTGTGDPVGFVTQGTNGGNFTRFIAHEDGKLDFAQIVNNTTTDPGGIVLKSATGEVVTGQWYHLALVRYGDNFRIYKDGQMVVETTDTDAWIARPGSLFIGTYYSGQTTYGLLDGFIDEFRISKGVARWKANFTPPAEPYN
jgi:hypothetical protein